MPTVSIDSRGVVQSDGNSSGLGISVQTSFSDKAILSSSLQVKASTDHENVMPYKQQTYMLAATSASITFGGHYTADIANTSGTFIMPKLATSLGSVFIVQNKNAWAHILSASGEAGQSFTTGSINTSFSVGSLAAGSRLTLPQSGSIAILNTGDKFVPFAASGPFIVQ